MKDWYQQWFNSPFYHKLYFDRDEKEAQGFIDRILQHLNPPAGSTMLDVACGKGRHSKYLSDKGYDVTGIDISFESIKDASRFENENLHFYQHDMRLPAWINYFNYAFNFFTSFGYFNTRREHDDAIRTLVNSLKQDGIFMIDYLNVHYVEEHLVAEEIINIDETRYEILRWMDENHFYKKIVVTDPTLEKPIDCTEKVAKFSLGDFTDMLSFNKMQVTEVFGNYQLSSYDISKTPRMIIMARK